MQLKKRAVSAVVSLAVTASLAAAPALLLPASAAQAPTADARTSVTAECAAAKSRLATAKTQKTKAARTVVKARKALGKAKKSHQAARVKKAKRVLLNARHRYAAKSGNVNTANKSMAYACSAPNSAVRANAIGQKTNLLALGAGTPTDLIGLSQLTGLLDTLLPGVSGLLSPAQLTSLLGGLNTGPLSLADATALLGGSFSPSELQSLLSGAASPAVLLELVQHIVGQLNGLTGNALPIPGVTNLTGVLDTIAGVFGALDPSQLGGLVGLLLTAVGKGGTTLDATQLTSLLDGLVPGLSGLLDPAQLTGLLGGLNGGGFSAATLTNLLGGQFSLTQIQSVLGGTAGADLVGEVLANVVAQLGTLGGGGLSLPGGAIDPSILTGLVTTITTLVTDVVGGLVTTVGGLVCTLLPILC